MRDGETTDRAPAVGRGRGGHAGRRAALAKLGLSAGAVYMAPTVLALRTASGNMGNTEVPPCADGPPPPKCAEDPPGGGPPDDPGRGNGNPNR